MISCSPLENFHAASSFEVLHSDPETFFTESIPQELQSILRASFVELILAIDMKKHFSTISRFQVIRRRAGRVLRRRSNRLSAKRCQSWKAEDNDCVQAIPKPKPKQSTANGSDSHPWIPEGTANDAKLSPEQRLLIIQVQARLVIIHCVQCNVPESRHACTSPRSHAAHAGKVSQHPKVSCCMCLFGAFPLSG